MKKSSSQKTHFTKRCLQRCGFKFSNETMNNIVWGISSKLTTEQLSAIGIEDLVFIEKQSNRVSKWGMKFRGIQYYIVYDRLRKTLVTILLPEKEYLSSLNGGEHC